MNKMKKLLKQIKGFLIYLALYPVVEEIKWQEYVERKEIEKLKRRLEVIESERSN